MTPPQLPGPPARRPWQVTTAVLTIGFWWAGASVAFAVVAGDGLADADIGPLFGLAFWAVVVFFLLRNVWRGGGSLPLVAKAAVMFGTTIELACLAMLAMVFFHDGAPLSLRENVMVMLHAGLPLYGGRLLLSPAAREYAESRAAQRQAAIRQRR